MSWVYKPKDRKTLHLDNLALSAKVEKLQKQLGKQMKYKRKQGKAKVKSLLVLFIPNRQKRTNANASKPSIFD